MGTLSTLASTETDVVVIGGGPAGSTAATLIAQQGYRTHLFERARFPRFHVGESLIPETYWVFERLGVLEKLKNSHFVKKCSVQFVNQRGRLSEPFYFTDHNPHESSQTWQVQRSELDKMLLDNAAEHGVIVSEGARVQRILFDGDRATGIVVQHEGGKTEQVHAKVTIDASGQSALIGNHFNLLVKDPKLKKGAVWTYYKGAYRDTGRDEGATLVLQTQGKKGWFWYIPLHDDVVSVGVVRGFDELFAESHDRETVFFAEVERCPEIKRRIEMGTRCDQFHATKDFSYRASRCAGDGWVLVGDAYGFLDPLYSSGVLLALRSGMLAADAVAEGLAKGDLSAAQLGKWGSAFNTGMDHMRKLVVAYYEGFNFGAFIRRYPGYKGTLTDLLIGALWKEKVADVFPAMDSLRAELAQARSL